MMWLLKLIPGKAFVYAGLALAILAAAGYVRYVFNDRDELKAELLVSEANLAALEYNIAAYEESVRLRTGIITDNLNTMTKLHRQGEERINELESLYAKHNLGLLITRKPNLVAGRFNAGTERVRKQLEQITADFAAGTD